MVLARGPALPLTREQPAPLASVPVPALATSAGTGTGTGEGAAPALVTPYRSLDTLLLTSGSRGSPGTARGPGSTVSTLRGPTC